MVVCGIGRPHLPSNNLIIGLLAAGMIFDAAHLACPVTRAWSVPALRGIVKREWLKHLVLPGAVLIAAPFGSIKWVALSYYAVYWTWNSYHFGMQNYGVLVLYGRRMLGFAALCATMLTVSVAPLIWPGTAMTLVLAGVSLHHWLTDIWLSSRVAQWRWWFMAAVLAIGLGFFGLRQSLLSVHRLPQIMTIVYAIGIVHFIYSARVWRLRDPVVRATINLGLFRASKGDIQQGHVLVKGI